MTENKKLKRKLIVQSFLPLSILIVIKRVTKETLGKIYCLLDSILHKCNIIETIQETGLRDDIWQILIGIIALWFAISGFITFWQFRQARFTAFNDDGDKIVIEDKIQDSGISFFMTFILSLLVDKVSTVNEFISYILVMWFVAELMVKTDLYYQNPVLILLQYKLYRVKFTSDIANVPNPKTYIAICREELDENKVVKWKYISDDVCLMYNKNRKEQ